MRAPVLAVVLSSLPSSGGAFDYETSILQILLGMQRKAEVSLRVFHSRGNDVLKHFPVDGFETKQRPVFLSRFARRWMPSSHLKIHELEVLSQISAQRPDLAYFLSPNELALHLPKIPVISTVWDLGHRDLRQFPEFVGNEWARRERLYHNLLPRSFHVFTDSSSTGRRIVDLYGVDASRWSPTGLLPVTHICQSCQDQVDVGSLGSYVLYPAKRWPHKNHLFLLEALAKARERSSELKLVLTGDRSGGGQSEIQQAVVRLGLQEAVVDLGLVARHDYQALLRGAIALVMPSLLGPTNIPPLEAFCEGIPSIVSDVHKFDADIGLEGSMTYLPTTDANIWGAHLAEISATRSRRTAIGDGPFRAIATREIRKVIFKFVSQYLSEVRRRV